MLNSSHKFKRSMVVFTVKEFIAVFYYLAYCFYCLFYLGCCVIEHLLPGWIQRVPVSQEALLSHVHHFPRSRVHGDGPLVAQCCLLRLLLGLSAKMTHNSHRLDSHSLDDFLNRSLRTVPAMINSSHESSRRMYKNERDSVLCEDVSQKTRLKKRKNKK